MFLLDYTWDIHKDRLVFDSMLDIKKYDWRTGDYFKVIYENGRYQLLKVDDLTLFALGVSKDGS